jgi:hypothetical protein
MAAKSKPNPAPKPEDNLDTAPLGDTPAAPAMLISISDLMESGKMALKAGTLGVTEASLSLDSSRSTRISRPCSASWHPESLILCVLAALIARRPERGFSYLSLNR